MVNKPPKRPSDKGRCPCETSSLTRDHREGIRSYETSFLGHHASSREHNTLLQLAKSRGTAPIHDGTCEHSTFAQTTQGAPYPIRMTEAQWAALGMMEQHRRRRKAADRRPAKSRAVAYTPLAPELVAEVRAALAAPVLPADDAEAEAA